MFDRGGFSFVAMLVINPIVILFYQNCSMAPVSMAKDNRPTFVSRSVASEQKPILATSKKDECLDSKKICPRQE
jgi:hypothetical protein